MKTLIFSVAASAVLTVGSMLPTRAEQPIIVFSDETTIVTCEFANVALENGFFDKFNNPRITGKCPDPNVGLKPSAGVASGQAAPVIAGDVPLPTNWPPIGPWCDCTDDEYNAIRSILEQKRIMVNPGYGVKDPANAWADAFNTDKSTVLSPKFWKGGTVPQLENFSDQQFILAE